MVTRATATIAGHTVSVIPQHREQNDSVPVFTLTVSVPVSFEDLTAAVWVVTVHGTTLDEVLNDIHLVIADTLVNDQAAVSDARVEIAELTPGTPGWEYLVQVQMVVLRAYGQVPAAVRPEPARLVVAR